VVDANGIRTDSVTLGKIASFVDYQLTSTLLSYLIGVSSSIQTQISNRLPVWDTIENN
jgi:hypothetical protein